MHTYKKTQHYMLWRTIYERKITFIVISPSGKKQHAFCLQGSLHDNNCFLFCFLAPA